MRCALDPSNKKPPLILTRGGFVLMNILSKNCYNIRTSTRFAIQSNRIQTKVIGVNHGNDHNTHTVVLGKETLEQALQITHIKTKRELIDYALRDTSAMKNKKSY